MAVKYNNIKEHPECNKLEMKDKQLQQASIWKMYYR